MFEIESLSAFRDLVGGFWLVCSSHDVQKCLFVIKGGKFLFSWILPCYPFLSGQLVRTHPCVYVRKSLAFCAYTQLWHANKQRALPMNSRTQCDGGLFGGNYTSFAYSITCLLETIWPRCRSVWHPLRILYSASSGVIFLPLPFLRVLFCVIALLTNFGLLHVTLQRHRWSARRNASQEWSKMCCCTNNDMTSVNFFGKINAIHQLCKFMWMCNCQWEMLSSVLFGDGGKSLPGFAMGKQEPRHSCMPALPTWQGQGAC